MKKEELEVLSEEEVEERKAFLRKVALGIGAYGVLCLAFVFLFKVVFMFSYIPSGSMEGSIMTGDYLISSRYDVDADQLERYDILIFNAPDEPDETYIKRLIGLPGETIEVSGGKVYANGVELDNSFIKYPQNCTGDGIYTVPEGCYFFLGDNRNNSYDSRFWDRKYVPLENIQAKAKRIIFPFSDVGSLEWDNGDFVADAGSGNRCVEKYCGEVALQ